MVGKRPNPKLLAIAAPLIVLAIGVGFKGILLAMDVFPFNADEAVVGLMARHVLEGEWPTFFYGQAYLGSLDATFVALGMAVFGKKVLVIRVVQVLLYASTILTTIHLGEKIFQSRWTGWVAGLLMAIPAVNVTLYTTVSLGGYGEALLIGNLLILLTLKIIETPNSKGLCLVWGGLAGLGFWTFGLTLIYILPCGLLILWKLPRQLRKKEFGVRVVILLMALLIGALPWIDWAVSHGPGQLIREMMGSAIAGTSSGSAWATILMRLRNFILLGTSVIFGLRPPWEVRWLALPLLPFAFAFWLLVVFNAFARIKNAGLQQSGRFLLFGVCGFLLVGYLSTPFGADPSGRYFLPLAVPLSLFAADFLVDAKPKLEVKWAIIIFLGILSFNLWGNLQSAFRNPPGITSQFDAVTRIDHCYDEVLIDFLVQHGELRGYSNYWVVYPLAFLSDEQLIYIPMLPYHQDFRYTYRDNRYEPYNPLVASADHVAYITTNHAMLDQFFRDGFTAHDMAWREIKIGDYQVFYDLEPSIHIEDLDPEWSIE
jgi:hypothetical protein